MSDDLVKRLREEWTTSKDEMAAASRIEELEALRDALGDKVRKLTTLLDDQFGTPCEQIRHKQEVEELEAKLAIAWDTQTVKILIKTAYKEGWADGGDNVPLGSGWEKSRTKATLAELTGDKND